ncbi:MAG: ABC transporter permease [Caldilineaceae bacterium]|nr:ABC transporter permease [Caldilineaceae bacterium]MDE0069712.1 ABC transporter permease [Caldilineaceae bacterium]MDE0428414.1 ABC transporter permease [Caldilineaceae bacterium]
MNERLAYLIMLVSVPILWVIAIEVSGYPSFLLPPPDMVGDVLWSERELLLEHTWATIVEAMTGYAVANVIAIALSISFLYLPWLEALAIPWTVIIKNVPFVTIATILIIILGDTPLPKIIIVVLVTFFPILANVTKGLKSADSVLLDRMQTLDSSQWEIFAKVRWPSALPYYIAAHEIAFTGSIIAAIVAEWIFARKGLGYLIVQSMTQYRADRLWAVTLIASVLAVGAYMLVKAVEKYLFRWQVEDLT